ncbi:hypothetical protein [Mycobacterium sp. 1274761.0]|uniref:hypothetical protein n=1 Tax=Mycobacterium sp. 1274761.0 TaxID=1834077 RepID=UPI00080210DE|nr:hypothetical protein [Mycobacterium sp. 1274761.0]OBK75513.1 hypothetical protein A5651_07560 [Mycobacterium sp. 1274761.0]
MSRALLAIPLVAIGLVSSAVGHANAECPGGWEFGPTLRFTQSDGWAVTVATSGRGVGGSAVGIPPNQGPLLRGTAEGGSDGATVAFGIGWDKGFETHYTGVVNQATGAVTGERPDGVTWKSTSNLTCIGGVVATPEAASAGGPPIDAPPA